MFKKPLHETFQARPREILPRIYIGGEGKGGEGEKGVYYIQEGRWGLEGGRRGAREEGRMRGCIYSIDFFLPKDRRQRHLFISTYPIL